MKRRLPDLSHVLDDSRPMPAVPLLEATRPRPTLEKRIHTRFDKAFLVVIGSELYGDSFAIARNISAGGLLVEMPYALPLGTIVTVHFQHVRTTTELERDGQAEAVARSGAAGPRSIPETSAEVIDEIVARAEVKHHHYLNFRGSDDQASARGIGLRFIEFLDGADRITADRIQ